MDPLTGLAVAAAAASAASVSTSKEVVIKILGPTADYLGNELLQWAQHRRENVGKIINSAEEKLGERINEEGRVPPKVLKEILDDGSFADEELAVEYFGGVLASSRSGIDRDDRGAAFAKLVSQLTSYQLRSHFLFYSLFKMLHDGSSYSVANGNDLLDMKIFIPHSTYISDMEFMPNEDIAAILVHSLLGLTRLNLINDDVRSGPAEYLSEVWPAASQLGILVTPSTVGVELFHWAFGIGHMSVNDFLDEQVRFESSVALSILPGSIVMNSSQISDAKDQGMSVDVDIE